MRPRLALACALAGALASLGVSARAAEAPPSFRADPYGDAPWTEAPPVLGRRFARAGRLVGSVAASQSLNGGYFNERELGLEAGYAPSELLTLSVALGYVAVQPTAVLTGPDGVLQARLQSCVAASSGCGDLTPSFTGERPWSGLIEARTYLTPIYGKLAAGGAWDLHFRLGLLMGLGVHGQRAPSAAVASDGATVRLEGTSFGDGGAFSDTALHVVGGGLLGVGLVPGVEMRVELAARLTPSDAWASRSFARLVIEVAWP